MEIVAKFSKVSFEQFKKDWLDNCPIKDKTWTDDEIKNLYNKIELPKRATKGSAGYDFYSYFPFTLKPGETIKVPTGIRVEIVEGWWLGILPRSGHGFKYRIQLDNTVGVIDSDYFNSDNEGHIFVKLTNDAFDSSKILEVKENQGFCQGLFIPFGITLDDSVCTERNGGFGSTTK